MDDHQTATSDSSHSGPPAALVRAIKRLLRPLVRMLLAHGVQLPYLEELLKAIYVDVARVEFPVEGREQTQSRISLLTGVHRKDVRRLLSEARDSNAIPPGVSLGVQIAARWLSDPDFVDENGHPRPLPRLASAGGPQSFEGLVSRVSKDIRSRPVLDEWLRLGVVLVEPDDRVRLKTEAFVQEKGFDEKVFFLGQNIHDHLAASVHNVSGGTPPYLERSTFYEGLSHKSVAELAEVAHEQGMRALLEVNRRALELQQRDAAHGPGGQRMNFGLYFYQGAEGEHQDADET